MLRRAIVIASVGLCLATGCRPKGETDLPICKAEVAGGEAEEVAAGEVPPNVWFTIVLRNFNRETMEVKRPVQDCSGRSVLAQPSSGDTAEPAKDAPATPPGPACSTQADGVSELAARPLTDDDLLISETSDGKMLVWVKTNHYDNGEAAGPVALAEWSSRGVLIRAIGTLRTYVDRAALRLEPMGKGSVLVAESRACEKDNPKNCQRVMRLVPLDGAKFMDVPMKLQDGTCLGAPQFDLYREKEIELETGMLRKFELARSVDFTDGNVVLSEQVTIKDSDPKQPDLPAQVFRKANVQRPMQLTKDALVTKAGLWDQMLAEHGSVTVREPKAEEAEATPTSKG